MKLVQDLHGENTIGISFSEQERANGVTLDGTVKPLSSLIIDGGNFSSWEDPSLALEYLVRHDSSDPDTWWPRYRTVGVEQGSKELVDVIKFIVQGPDLAQ